MKNHWNYASHGNQWSISTKPMFHNDNGKIFIAKIYIFLDNSKFYVMFFTTIFLYTFGLQNGWQLTSMVLTWRQWGFATCRFQFNWKL